MADPNDKRTDGAPPSHVHIEDKKSGIASWLPWLLLALGLLALILALSRCNRDEPAAVVAPAAVDPVAPAVVPVAVERVTLPGGAAVDLEPASLNYELQRYLASPAPAPRTFTFDKLNFDTSSSAIRAEDQPTLAALAQIMQAYPNARVRLVGYADARGTDPANAQLGAQRAQAVAAALTQAGVATGRVETASGGENNPVDSNATAEGQFENRRTELVVTAK